MEQNQPVEQQADVVIEPAAKMPDPAPPEAQASNRTMVYVIVTALIFFILGYGVAWFSFYTATTVHNSVVDDAVQDALEAALANLDLQAAPTAEPTVAAVVENVNVAGQPAFGPEDAPITIVEFSDFRCSYCGRFFSQTLEPLMEQYSDQIRFVYRDFPVVGGERAAMAAECVYAQSEDMFWEYHDILFNNQSVLNSDSSLVELGGQVAGLDQEALETCLSEDTYQESIELDIAEGLEYGVRGTPAFFINGNRLIGAQPVSAFQTVIEGLLAE